LNLVAFLFYAAEKQYGSADAERLPGLMQRGGNEDEKP
jgi:hypothetical protein